MEHKGRVKCLEIENFKSYEGKQVIGPFKNFTTIIGPNGSGKSNLMDAISFVLGVKTGVLRGNNLGELLYSGSASAASQTPQLATAQVSLVFEAPDGSEITFTRAIQRRGDGWVSVYKLDGRVTTAEAYDKHLESFGILVRARNFLVFQGDIENVAQMSPKDMTTLFETISGSAALKQRYEEAETAAREANATLGLLFTKRKALAAEKKTKREQKEEAERHMALANALEAAKVKLALWQLYHLAEDAKEERVRAADLENAVAYGEQAASEAAVAAEEQRRTAASLAKRRLILSKTVAAKRLEVERQTPALIAVQERITHAQRRLEEAQKSRALSKNKAAERHRRIADLKKQLAELKAALATIESDLESENKKSFDLSEKRSTTTKATPLLLKEYETIKKKVGVKIAHLVAEKEACKAALEADEDALALKADTVASIDQRIAGLRETKQADEEKLKRAKDAVERATLERNKAKAERENVLAERRRVEARRAQLERRVEEVEGKLREAKAESKLTDREAARRRLVKELQDLFPRSVYGLVTDLADATHQRYRLAMSVVLGKDFDSVIVDTPETAMQCIRIVKERRAPPMTFLPAETMKTKIIDPALRSLGGTARLAIDCLDVKDERCERAFRSICGATLICEGTIEAKRLAFGGDELDANLNSNARRHKVVATDGTAFLKNGIITGGVTASLERRAGGWDAAGDAEREKEKKALQERKSGAAQELSQLPSMRELMQQLQAVEAAVSRAETTLAYASADVKATREKVEETETSIQSLLRQRESGRGKEEGEIRKRMADRRETMARLEAKISKIEDAEFAEFCSQLGVSNVREFKGSAMTKETEKLMERRGRVGAQMARVTGQLEYEETKAEEEQLKGDENADENLEGMLSQLMEERREVEAAAKQAEQALAETERQLTEIDGAVGEAEKKGKEVRGGARAAADSVAARKRDLEASRAKIERIEAAYEDVLNKATTLEGLQLPLTSHSKSTSGSDNNKGKKSRKNDDVDFSSLSGAELARRGRSDMEAEMKRTIEETASQLAGMAPNMKALEQYQAVKDREREQMEELEAAKKAAREAGEAFDDVREKRIGLFNAALDHVASVIDGIYKQLTRSDAHPMGGQAYLSAENSEEPFGGGVKFSAMPPTKRFRDMEQLSGGEKSVAALALLFAIHSFHPSPFFVLDEVDAALDAGNVARVALYMRSQTRAGVEGGFQGIVISLKDTFYEKADALVGVCRDPTRGCSSTLTFDLERFGPPTGSMA